MSDDGWSLRSRCVRSGRECVMVWRRRSVMVSNTSEICVNVWLKDVGGIGTVLKNTRVSNELAGWSLRILIVSGSKW